MNLARLVVVVFFGFVGSHAFAQNWTFTNPVINAEIFYQSGIDASGACPSGTTSGYIAVYRDNGSGSDPRYTRIEVDSLHVVDGLNWDADLTRASGEWPMGPALVVVSKNAPPLEFDGQPISGGYSAITITFVDEH
jgi:hypothetical protein